MSWCACSRITHYASCGLLAFGFLITASAAETNSIASIQFDRDVRPIFQQSCFRCHGPEKPKSEFRLDDRTEALKGGDDNTNDIVPGHSEQSALIRYVAGLDEKIRMPPPDRGAPLTPVQVGILKAWIDQGAPWGTNVQPQKYAFSVTPTLRWIDVHGNPRKFRELEGVKEGFGGGADEFSASEQLAPDEKLTLSGHVRMPEHDIKATLALDQNDFGYVHGGFEEWRQYYNDIGGYYPSFQPSTFSLGRDLHLDIGRLWIDVGLTPPDKPQVVLGYEYQFRQGAQSMLAWGPVYQAGSPKNIYPDAEDISEHTHIIKIDISDTLWGWNVDDWTRIELYHLAETRNDDNGYTTGPNPDSLIRVDQSVHYTQGANTLRVEKQVTDWWLVSAGGLLSEFDGTTLLNQSTVNAFGAPIAGQYWWTDGITLRRLSRVVSVGSLLLPLRGLSVSAGAQGEWTHEDGFGSVNQAFDDPTLPGTPYSTYPVNANQDRTEASENLNIRFTRLPRTVLFAEARGQQESVGQFDQGEDLFFGTPVEQRTDALNHFYDARTGLTTSPWSWLELGGHYRRRDSSTGYNNNNLVDLPGTGYPGFITHRDIALDEVEGRIVLRPVSWWNARLTYDRDRTGFSSTTGSYTNSMIGFPILDGRTASDSFGLGMTFTPWARFYFSGSATYSHSRTTTATGENSAAAVVPYVGDIWTLNASAGYALNEKTTLSVTYVYSESGYGQNNTAGLPLGLDFTRHELLAGIKRQITKRLSGALRYEFSEYVEPSSGNVNNFTAHGVFAALDYRWP